MRLRERPVLLGELGISFPECACDECSAKCPCARNQHKAMSAALRSLAGPARIACLSSMQELRFHECPTFKRLPSYVGELGVLQELSFSFMARLKALPDARGLTALQSLQISYCPKIKQLPMGIGELPSLKHLTLEGLNELEEVPGPFTALESMYICFGEEIGQLGTGGGELGSRKELTLERCYGLNDLPILTALEQLHIEQCDPSLTHIGEMAALRELQPRDVAV